MVRSLAVARVLPQARQVVRWAAFAAALTLARDVGCDLAPAPSTSDVPSRKREGRRVALAPGVRARAYERTSRSRARVMPT